MKKFFSLVALVAAICMLLPMAFVYADEAANPAAEVMTKETFVSSDNTALPIGSTCRRIIMLKRNIPSCCFSMEPATAARTMKARCRFIPGFEQNHHRRNGYI